MPKKLSTVLGIDVGSQQIKLAEVKMQGREPAISALAIGPTPEGAVDHTGLYDSDNVAAAIKGMLTASGSSAPYAVISIAGQASILVRTLEVPKMSGDELKEHMNWEISRSIPFAETTVQQDFKAYEGGDPAATNQDVVMAVAPQSAVDTMISVITKSGKKPFAIDVEPLALARSTATSYGEALDNKTLCVVDIGHQSTAINIYRNGQLLMPRVIPLGGFQFTRAIADNMALTEQDAEDLKKTRATIPDNAGAMPTFDPFGATQGLSPFDPFNPDPLMGAIPTVDPNIQSINTYNAGGSESEAFVPYSADPMAGMTPPVEEPAFEPMATQGFEAPPPVPEDLTPEPATLASADPEADRIYRAFASVLDEFMSEVRRSVDHFRSKGGEVDQILLCGGGSKLRGLEAFMGKVLSVPTERYDALRRMNIVAKRLDTETIEGHREEFAVAVGNALHICFD